MSAKCIICCDDFELSELQEGLRKYGYIDLPHACHECLNAVYAPPEQEELQNSDADIEL